MADSNIAGAIVDAMSNVPVFGQIAEFLKGLGGIFDTQKSNLQRQTVLLTEIADTLNIINGNLAEVMAAVANIPIVQAEEEKPAAGGGTSQVGIQQVLGTLSAAASALSGIVSQASAFVEALNPGLMAQFSQAIRNLQATIGQALEPIIFVATNLANVIGGILQPLMVGLAPIIQALSDAIGNILIAAISVLVAVIKPLLPFLLILADGLKLLSEWVKTFYIVFATLLDAFLTALFGSGEGLRDMMARLRVAMYQLMTGILQLVLSLLIIFGLQETARRIVDNLSEQARGQTAALQNVGVASFEQIARDLAVAAATAGGTPQEDPSVALQRQMADTLRQLVDGRGDLGQRVSEIRDLLRRLGTVANPVNWVRAGVRAAYAVATVGLSEYSGAGGAALPIE